ncbi:AzlD domain-containing protein [Advenella sp. S44]|uniref:AzlD domain-containing protein n=1 Tax=Advenella sp. S44 TaxID=1982755 RepID=UPI0013747B1D|nr:AzlD domain-containing protein [Advenella sp. S44]
MGNTEFWLAIAVMAVVTWLSRALPFVLMRKSNIFGRLASGRFVILGPALLVSMSVVVVYSDLQQDSDIASILVYFFGLIAAGVCARLTGNAGFSVLAGMAGYAAALFLLPI